MQMKPRMLHQPRLPIGVVVRRVVVQDQMHRVPFGTCATIVLRHG